MLKLLYNIFIKNEKKSIRYYKSRMPHDIH